MTAQSHEATDLACMLRDALCADPDRPSDVQRRWSSLRARIETPQRRWSGLRARIETPQRRWSGLLARIETPQRLNSGHQGIVDQMPCAWLLGWRMISLARAVS
jgi:hypothetical protein